MIRSLCNIFTCLFAVLFIALNIGADLHAMEHGDAIHHHSDDQDDNRICKVMALADDAVFEGADFITDSPVTNSVIVKTVSAYASVPFARPFGRAPPPRSPPLTA